MRFSTVKPLREELAAQKLREQLAEIKARNDIEARRLRAIEEAAKLRLQIMELGEVPTDMSEEDARARMLEAALDGVRPLVETAKEDPDVS